MSHYTGTGVRVLTIANNNREDLGFTIKGGSEQGTPVSVSRVETGSDAGKGYVQKDTETQLPYDY